MQLLAHSASERPEDSRITKRPIFRVNQRTNTDQKCSFKITSACIGLAQNLQLAWAECSWLEPRLAWRSSPWGRVPACAPRLSAHSLRRCQDGSQEWDLSLLQLPPSGPEQGQLQAGPQDAAVGVLHRALVSGRQCGKRSVVLELCVLCGKGKVFSKHAGGGGSHASPVLSPLVCLFRSLCVVLNTLASWK